LGAWKVALQKILLVDFFCCEGFYLQAVEMAE
jgi:hypothetical protein